MNRYGIDVHRGLKPTNVKIKTDDAMKVLDVGAILRTQQCFHIFCTSSFRSPSSNNVDTLRIFGHSVDTK